MKNKTSQHPNLSLPNVTLLAFNWLWWDSHILKIYKCYKLGLFFFRVAVKYLTSVIPIISEYLLSCHIQLQAV